MALSRRTGARFEATIWPGFVDALTALLLILMFVLSIFMIVQFSLRETVTGQTEKIATQEDELARQEDEIATQGAEIDRLSQQLAALADVLSLEQGARAAAETEVGELRASLSREEAESDRLDAALAAMANARRAAEARAESLSGELDAATEEARLAAARREAMEALIAELRAESEAQAEALAATGERLTAEEEARALEAAAAEALRRRLASSEAELDAMTLSLEAARAEAERTLTLLAAAEVAKRKLEGEVAGQESALSEAEALRRLAESQLAEVEAQTAEEARKTALLNQQVGALRDQLGTLQALLDDAESRDRDQKVQIAELGSKLNAALAQKVSELARFRSEFFGRMREVLGGRDDIRVVGDRFVFQSEVLFAPGSAELNPAGISELAKLGQVLREVAGSIPEGLDWILRVDGHTDATPIRSAGPYGNWELSQARALSVVRYLVDREGVPPERLAAAGFGEYQPIAEGDSPEALARNRRIEFKFTER